MINRSIKCSEWGCNQILNYEQLEEHLKNDCQYVEEDCKFKKLGCEWRGIRREQNNHYHENINLDTLLQRIESNDVQIEQLKQDNQDLLDEVKQAEEEMVIIRKSFDIFLKSNITASFRLIDIWKEFNVTSISPYPEIVKYIGCITHGIQLKLYFRIIIKKTPQLKSNIRLEFQVSGQAFKEQKHREIHIRLDYVSTEENDTFFETRCYPIMFKCKFETTFVSSWHGFTTFKQQISGLSDADKIVMTQPTGNIKFFAIT